MRPAGFTSHSQSTCRVCCQADALVLRGACRSERSFGPGLRGWCNLLITPNLFSVCSCPSCKLTLGVGPLFHAHPHHRKSSNTSVIYPAFTLFLKPSINERLDSTPARLDDVLTCNPCPYYDRSLVILVLPRCEETTLPCLSLTWPRRLTFARRTLDQSPLANLGTRRHDPHHQRDKRVRDFSLPCLDNSSSSDSASVHLCVTYSISGSETSRETNIELTSSRAPPLQTWPSKLCAMR